MKYIYWVLIIIGIIVAGIAIKKSSNYKKNWETAMSNVKAYDELLSTSNKKNVAYQFTVDQLSFIKDSLLKELNTTRESLNIKKDNVKSLQYVGSSFSHTDTLYLPQDTIFRDSFLTLDTVIGDTWFQEKLQLKYPSTIVVSPSFKSEKQIIVSTRKETVNPPKKWWLLRLFQKKHKVLQVDVIESNPYVSNEESRYIEVIK